MVRLLKSVLIGLLSVLVVLAPGGVAVAHDELISSDPGDGDTLDEAPEELVLTFSGQIAEVGAQLQVTGEDGAEVVDGDPEVRGTDLVQPLTDVGPGDYEVVWRVTSSDGHPISGSFAFTVEAPVEPEVTEDATDEATQDVTEEVTEEATEEVVAEPTEQAQTSAPAAGSTEGGVPGWVWALVGVAALALAALLARTWSRGRE
jgi:copper resistance protein C